VYVQGVVTAPGVNPLGVVLSNALAARPGGR
jgi:hypothetical protein